MYQPNEHNHYCVKIPSERLFRINILVLLFFMCEALIAKSIIPRLHINFVRHMVGTGFMLIMLFFLAMYYESNSVRQVIHPKVKRIKICVALMIFWGFLSCIPQQKMIMANFCFWLLWAGNLYVIWWSIPKLLIDCSMQLRIRFIMTVLLICVIGCALLHPVNGMVSGRLRGMFVNATFSGEFFAFSLVFWFCLWLNSLKRSWWLLPLIAITSVLLIMTRTRSAIFASLVGCIIAIVTSMFGPLKHLKKNSIKVIVLSLLGITVLLLHISEYVSREEIVHHFRVEGGIRKVYKDRSNLWERGYRDFLSNGFFGRGFMSKFGDKGSTREIWGITIPRYDWETVEDPLNMFFLICQQIGIPGALLLLFLLIAMWRAKDTIEPKARSILVSFLSTGLILGCLGGNWLVSFGDPIDRFCFIVFSMLFSGKKSGNFILYNNGHQTSAHF